MVGAAGFELATLCSQSRCATRLRYTPTAGILTRLQKHFGFANDYLHTRCMHQPNTTLPWLKAGDEFPKVTQAWGPESPAPGLLAAGGALDVATLLAAYSRGIFPWFSDGQPILWWSTSPRMVLHVPEFRLHRSLKKSIRKFRERAGSEIRIDYDFQAVLDECSHSHRPGQSGTWIVPEMKAAYLALHRRGHAHSIETWQDGKLIGGLYCVSVGNAVFGESMFSHQTDASKIALSALVGMAMAQGVTWIDCQQVTDHLAFMGARPVERSTFSEYLQESLREPQVDWVFQPIYWDRMLSACTHTP
jgi:leucyl/phenylalanyl-tRNA--protein transferase